MESCFPFDISFTLDIITYPTLELSLYDRGCTIFPPNIKLSEAQQYDKTITIEPTKLYTMDYRDNNYCKRSEEHTSELQSRGHLVCRLLLEKKKKKNTSTSQN